MGTAGGDVVADVAGNISRRSNGSAVKISHDGITFPAACDIVGNSLVAI